MSEKNSESLGVAVNTVLQGLRYRAACDVANPSRSVTTAALESCPASFTLKKQEERCIRNQEVDENPRTKLMRMESLQNDRLSHDKSQKLRET